MLFLSQENYRVPFKFVKDVISLSVKLVSFTVSQIQAELELARANTLHMHFKCIYNIMSTHIVLDTNMHACMQLLMTLTYLHVYQVAQSKCVANQNAL